jgi:hypothetical protein
MLRWSIGSRCRVQVTSNVRRHQNNLTGSQQWPTFVAAGAATGLSRKSEYQGLAVVASYAPHEATQRAVEAMELTLDTLQAELLKLSTADRARLLDVLLDSIDVDEEVEQEWERLADEREAELDSGAVVAVDGPTVLARLRAKYGA